MVDTVDMVECGEDLWRQLSVDKDRVGSQGLQLSSNALDFSGGSIQAKRIL